jgi:hypothetical protein
LSEQHLPDFSACRYTGADEGTHEANEENYNESVYFNFYDPVARVGAVLRVGNHPTLGYAEMSVNMPLPDGSVAFRYGREDSTENSHFASGGMAVEIEEPTRRMRLSYEGEVSILKDPSGLATNAGETLRGSPVGECSIQLHWTARYPLHVLDLEGKGRITPGGESDGAYASNHYEQFGAFTGEIVVADQRWAITDAPAFRDHSWGRRDWSGAAANFTSAYLANGSCLSAIGALQPEGRWACHGAVLDENGVHPINRYDVTSAYAGEAKYTGPFSIAIGADGVAPMQLDGILLAFVPLRAYNKKTDTGIRIAQTLAAFESDATHGWGWSDLTRPLSGGR